MTRSLRLLGILLAALISNGARLASAAPAVPTSKPDCPGHRYVGFKATGSCPNPAVGSGWTKLSLFAAGAPAELTRYCVYEWSRSLPSDPGTLPRIAPSNDQGWLYSDCTHLAPNASPFTEENQAELEAAFRRQVNVVSPMPMNLGIPPPTKVVVVDASPNSAFPYPADGLIEHGLMVGMVVRQLACPDVPNSPCRAIVANSLALPLVKVGDQLFRQVATGGRLGSYSDLAAAVVNGYREAEAATPVSRIVMNLSLGWTPDKGGAYPGNNWMSLEPPIRLVQSALSYVGCRGGLVIAASGNSSGGPEEVPGLSMPAAWEAKPAPNAARCNTLGGLNDPFPAATTYRRLVYAAGGVDGRDRPIATTRPGSLPFLVGPADHASISSPLAVTDVYSGTSVGTAVLTAAVAAVWSYLPVTSRYDVMEAVRSGSIPISGLTPELTPDDCGQVLCPSDVRVVNMCAALLFACSISPYCPMGWAGCTAPTLPRDERPTNLSFTRPGDERVVTRPPRNGDSALCESEFYAASGVPDQCPHRQYESTFARPFSGPQPGPSLCPTCPFMLESGKFLIEINPALDQGTLIDKPTLTVDFLSGDRKTYAIDVAAEDLFPGAVIVVEGFPFTSTDVEAGTVHFQVNGSYSSEDPIIIER